jgi:4-hydroxybenzoate polyprenyltransferase
VAWISAIVLGAAALSLSFLLRSQFGFAVTGYAALNLGYSLALKHMVIVDVMAIAAGFVIRAVSGSLVIDGSALTVDAAEVKLDLTISPWLYVVTALGALFLALAKRRSELVTAGQRSTDQRATLSEYSVGLLDQMIAIVAPATLLAYTLYTFSSSSAGEPNIPDNGSMLFTVPFVAYGLFRYLYLLHRHNRGEAPEDVLLSDKPLLINIVLWLLTAAGVLLANRLM